MVDSAGAALTAAELAEWVRPRLDREKWPRSWCLVDAELQDATGKVRSSAWR